ncbi:MAG TPA: alpha/beta fold hydrolase [Acidimicrobiales bacterium]|nr:alpha/beta fold hydrolase [Acidimicrobiales bacterium]
MSTTQVRPVHPADLTTPPTGDTVSRDPIARIVAGSVLTGLVGALFLTLVVFAGATEHVTTGSALLAFATGWIMLAVLSTRMSSQPQRWAFVPAGAMGSVGTALLLFAPGDDALRTMGWLWPAAVLALAVWIGIASRRHLESRTRAWLLYPIVAFLVLGAVGGGYETVRLSLDRSAYAMPGRSYDVGGHRLHLNCTGAGSPTVVLANGLGVTSPEWAWIATALAADTRICAYDRAGQGWSEDAAGPQDGAAIAADLHTLLQRAMEPGPYVLVGHSLGGPYAMTYAARYPDEVAGLVLLDATSPEAFTVLPSFPSTHSMMRRLFGVAPSLSRLGVGHAIPGETLPGAANDQARAFATSPRNLRSQRDELSQLRASLTQARAFTGLGGKPLAVLTAGEGQQAGWSAAQDRMAALSTNSLHRVAPATHASLLTDKSDSIYSVRAIADVVRSVRTGSRLPTS